jgi:hypothetical protein
MTFLVTITLSFYMTGIGSPSWDYDWAYLEVPNLEVCNQMKHQLESIPPAVANSAEIYFCIKEG